MEIIVEPMTDREIAAWVAEFRQGARSEIHPLIKAIDALLDGDESRRGYVESGIAKEEIELAAYKVK